MHHIIARDNLISNFGRRRPKKLIFSIRLAITRMNSGSTRFAWCRPGAEVDTRTYLLPDTITWGAIALGILSAPVLNPFEPWVSAGAALARATGTAFALVLLRGSGIVKVLVSAMSSSPRRSAPGSHLSPYRSASRLRLAPLWWLLC
jgi:hypothetical protein